MDMQFVLDNFEYIFDSEEKIKNFDNIILQLAVSGKLNTQNPNDEPASELLKKIKSEKDKLIKDKKIRKEEPLQPIKEAEIPYKLPQGWQWCKLNDICWQITDGAHHTPTYIEEGIPFLSVKDITKGFIDFSNTRFISEEEHKKLITRCNPEFEDLLLTKVGTTGIAKVIDTNKEFSIFVSLALLKFFKFAIYPYFLEYLINSPVCKKQSEENTQGVGNKNLVLRLIKEFIIPIPPLEEQKRIVEVVEKLLSKSAEIKEYLSKRNKKLIILNQSALHHLQESKTDEEFKKHFNLITDNFNNLYVNQENLKGLRQTILQLAVQGKLVSQNSNDEPAIKLLKKIKAEKEKLIKEGKIKKDNPLLPINETDLPYKLPQGWEWTKLGEIVEILNGYAFKSNTYVEKSINQVIRLGNVKNTGLLLNASPVYIPEEIAQTANNYEIFENDILVTLTGTRLKRDYFYTGLVTTEDLKEQKLFLNQRVGCIRCNNNVFIPLINVFLKTNIVLDAIFKTETGTANQGNIGTTSTKELLFPLPPLKEQKRIVAKVDELMTLCDQLEEKINKKNKTSEALIQSVLNNIFNSKKESIEV